jgi:acetolactate synthase I/III small subunit
MRHTLSALIQNTPGVTARITGLMARRGFNIDSLVAAQTHDPDFFYLTVSLDEPSRPVAQVLAQLNKLVNVVRVSHLDQEDCVEIEMLLAKIDATTCRAEVVRMAEDFPAMVLEDGEEVVVLGIAGNGAHLDSFAEKLRSYPIIEQMRTGPVAMRRGKGRT